MKLVFKKSEDAEISVFISNGKDEVTFDYISMVKSLIEEREMETPDIIGDFTSAEIESIKSMVLYLNEALKPAMEAA